MAVKMTLFYEQTQAGWTEIWYRNGDTPPIVLDSQTDSVLRKAIAVRTRDTELIAIRFSVEGKRLSNSFRFNRQYVGQTSNVVDANEFDDVVSTSLLTKVRDDTFHTKHMWLRGLNDVDVQRDDLGNSNPSASLVKSVNAYYTAARNAGWQIRWQQTPDNTPGLVYNPISVIAANLVNNEFSDVLFQNVHGMTSGPTKFVRLLTVSRNDLPGLPRIANIKAIVDPFTITIPYRLRAQAAVKPKRGRGIVELYSYTAINSWDLEVFGERKTGRPFGVPRGRSSAVVRAQ